MSELNERSVELGCGLIAIGRQWGTTPEVPGEFQARAFLDVAQDLGVRFFDTAPAYGLSEERLGSHLDSLAPGERQETRVATKFGEHWNPETGEPYTDHSYDALMRSYERSRWLLGKISLLQVHKSTPEVIQSEDVQRALEAVKEDNQDIRFGASVSDEETASIVLGDDRFEYIQLPFNQANPMMRDTILAASGLGKKILVNRPQSMGGTVSGAKTRGEKEAALSAAYGFVLETVSEGVVLSGTSNPDHLKENVAAFTAAMERAASE